MTELNQNTLIKDSIEFVISREKICALCPNPSFTKKEIEENGIQSLMTSEVVEHLMNDPVILCIDIDQDEWDYYELNDKVNEMLVDEHKEDLDEIQNLYFSFPVKNTNKKQGSTGSVNIEYDK